MECSQRFLASPAITYADPGSTMKERRCHLSPCRRLNLKVHEERSETPTTRPKTNLSLCQPIGAPGLYSVTKACCNRLGSMAAKAAANSRADRRNGGISSLFRTRSASKSYFQP